MWWCPDCATHHDPFRDCWLLGGEMARHPDEKKRWWVWQYLLHRYRWYRRWCGGHWEEWCNDATHTDMWFQMDRCSREDGYRPGACFGTPVCEDHSPGVS